MELLKAEKISNFILVKSDVSEFFYSFFFYFIGNTLRLGGVLSRLEKYRLRDRARPKSPLADSLFFKRRTSNRSSSNG